MDEATARLSRPDPLTEDETRALLHWVNQPLHNYLPRVQMDLALQQIGAIKRLDEASTKLTKRGMWLVGLQTFAALVAVVISVLSLLRH